MSTESKQTTSTEKPSIEEKLLHSTRQFWGQYSKLIVGALTGLVLVIAGYFAYQNFVVAPAEAEANEAIWKAQASFKIDSFNLALKGDGTKLNPGLLKVISKHDGTKAANLAHFYAGICYLKLGDFNNAIKNLEAFAAKDEELLMRKYGSLGDAYAESGKNEQAIENYSKAASAFETDEAGSAEYLFRLAQLNDKLGKTKEAVEAFSAIKDKYPQTPRAAEVEKYLAKLGETK
jgi:tetratricopeptide (TPR) repeat protein